MALTFLLLVSVGFGIVVLGTGLMLQGRKSGLEIAVLGALLTCIGMGVTVSNDMSSQLQARADLLAQCRQQPKQPDCDLLDYARLATRNQIE